MSRIKIAFVGLMALVSCSGPRYRSWNRDPRSLVDPVTGRYLVVNDTEEIRARDSLVRLIDLASREWPEDIAQTTLIVEIPTYEDWRKLFATKYYAIPDNHRVRSSFRRFRRDRQRLFEGYVIEKVYANKGSYDEMDLSKFRYVVKITARFSEYTRGSGDSLITGYNLRTFDYVYDRKENIFYKEMNSPMSVAKK